MHWNAGRLILQNLHDLGPEEACLKAVTDILEVPHHVYLIEVQDIQEEEGETDQVAVHDPYGRLGDVQRLNEGRLLTVKVPGYGGDYVLVIFPFVD
jgi:hypothetical protein